MEKKIKYTANLSGHDWDKFSPLEKLEFFRQLQMTVQREKKGQKRKPNPIGDRIVFLRDYYGYTQVKLAELSGVSRYSIIRYEQQGCTPSLDNLEAIANSLCGVFKFVTYCYEDGNPDFRESILRPKMEDGELPPEEPQTFEEFKHNLHKMFQKSDLYCRYPHGLKFMSSCQREMLLAQLDATIDFAESMLLRAPTEPFNKNKPKIE